MSVCFQWICLQDVRASESRKHSIMYRRMDLCYPGTVLIKSSNKFALLWGEAQLCLPYVRLRKKSKVKKKGDLGVGTQI